MPPPRNQRRFWFATESRFERILSLRVAHFIFHSKTYVPVHVASAAMPNACTLLCRWWCFSHYGYNKTGLLGPSVRSDTAQNNRHTAGVLRTPSLFQQTISKRCQQRRAASKKLDLPAGYVHIVLSGGCEAVEWLQHAPRSASRWIPF